MPKLRDLIDNKMKVKMGEVRTDKDYPPFAKTESEWKKQWNEEKIHEGGMSTIKRPRDLSRMESLHNLKHMKEMLKYASLIYQDMEEEGFDGAAIYDFLFHKINKTNL